MSPFIWDSNFGWVPNAAYDMIYGGPFAVLQPSPLLRPSPCSSMLRNEPIKLHPFTVERPDPYPDVDRVSRTPLQIGLSLPDPPPPSTFRHREPDAFETISAMLEKNKIHYEKERAFADGMMEGLTKSGLYRP